MCVIKKYLFSGVRHVWANLNLARPDGSAASQRRPRAFTGCKPLAGFKIERRAEGTRQLEHAGATIAQSREAEKLRRYVAEHNKRPAGCPQYSLQLLHNDAACPMQCMQGPGAQDTSLASRSRASQDNSADMRGAATELVFDFGAA